MPYYKKINKLFGQEYLACLVGSLETLGLNYVGYQIFLLKYIYTPDNLSIFRFIQLQYNMNRQLTNFHGKKTLLLYCPFESSEF